MTLKRLAIPGQNIPLRTIFRDELSGLQQGSNVLVSIFPPNTTEFIPANAYLTSGTPTYLGDGIYEYMFTVPVSAVSGLWFDFWTGDLPYQTVSGLASFQVETSATITQFGTQLHPNNLVEVTIASGIMGTDGSVMSEPYNFQFLTVTDPTYTDIRKMRLEVGAFIQNIDDDALQDAILEASIQANAITFSPIIYNNPLFLHARREYVTYLAIRYLLDNVSRGLGVRSKSLGDLAVQYDPAMMLRIMDKADERLQKWEAEVMAAGGARQIQMPRYMVPGELDPDKPQTGRLWETNADGNVGRRMPAANTRQKPRGKRRYSGTYFPFLTTPGWSRRW